MHQIQGLESRCLLASVLAGFSDSIVANGVTQGTAMALVPDGRIFVAEQRGSIRVIKNGSYLPAPFLQVDTVIDGSRGLIGLAVDPNFASNKYVYTYFSVKGANKNRLSRFTANGDVMKAGSEKILWESPVTTTNNHNGGSIRFGKDGKLYLATGDGFVPGNSQSLTSPFGKILRFNADGTIPGDNPFYSTATGSNRAIWALGLRNPYTFAIHKNTGKMLINDVGADLYEEVDEGTKGANFGWETHEGPANDPKFKNPYYSYPHSSGATCVIGAAFYTPMNVKFPSSYVNQYFFGDYVAGFIKSMDHSGSTPKIANFATGFSRLVDLQVGSDGALYYLERGTSKGDGFVGKISFVQGAKPAISLQPVSQTVVEGRSVTFQVSATGSPTLKYQWYRNGQEIHDADKATYSLENAESSDNGATFKCKVTNSFGSGTSSSATLTVIADKPPVPVIVTPAIDIKYRGGTTIDFSGTAIDPEDGELPASAYSWDIEFHHQTHTHPYLGPIDGVKSGTFPVLTVDEPDPVQWFRIYLTATDSLGVSTTTFKDVFPAKVKLTLSSSVPGIALKLDNDPVTPGAPNDAVIGRQRQLVAPITQMIDGVTYQFVNWSDGGAATHEIVAPETDTLYTATYQIIQSNIAASYFSNSNLTGDKLSRNESTVDFNWGAASPDPSIGVETWSARWESNLIAPITGATKFSMLVDDGARLWINDQLVIDKWASGSAKTEYFGSIDLEAGVKYSFKMEYYDGFGNASAKLRWAGEGLAKQVIPASAFTQVAGPTSETTTIGASADGYVRGGIYSADNFGSGGTLAVKTDFPLEPDKQRESYIRFDISSIPTDKALAPGFAAKLRLNGYLNSNENSSVVANVLGDVTDPWEESTLTYANRPMSDAPQVGQISVSGTIAKWYELDLTALIRQARTDGKSLVTLRFVGATTTRSQAIFASRESLNGPQMIVTTPV